jgi:transposase
LLTISAAGLVMAKPLLPDALWSEIAPLFPPAVPRPKGGRPPVEDRKALLGILFVLQTGIPWEWLPAEVAGCSGMTCWRRLRAWQDAGLWDKIHRHMLDRLSRAGAIDWSRASLDASSAPAKKGAMRSARTLPIAASRAPSAISSSTARACLSPSS